MDVASLELCKELYKLSRWALTEKHWYKGELVYNAPYGWDCSAYDLGFLLRKLPAKVENSSPLEFEKVRSDIYLFRYGGLGPRFMASYDTPEDAACMLAIELFKQGIITK
jgi:hypothetical protein